MNGVSATGPWTSVLVGADTTFSFTLDSPRQHSEGVFITVRARDERHEVTQNLMVKIDRVGPVVRLLRPDDGSFVSPTVEVAAEATDGSGALSALVIAGTPEPSPVAGKPGLRTLDVPDLQWRRGAFRRVRYRRARQLLEAVFH